MPHFRVATYNVYLHDWDDPATVAAIGATEADIVALQEVTYAWKDVLLEEYGERWPHMAFRAEENGAGGLAVLSAYPIEELGFHVGPGDWHPAWHVLVHTPMGPVQLFNVHLRPMFSGGSGPVDSYLTLGEDHIEQISTYAADYTFEGPTIVLGDFNEGPGGEALSWLERRGFRNVLPLFHPGQETFRVRSVGNQFAEAIDHILYDDSFTPLDAWVVQRGNSDHLPVVAHFEAGGIDAAPAPTGTDP